MWNVLNESMSEFCSSAFWDTNLTWNTPDPDFTLCFEKTVLTWVPCAFLWFFLPLEIYFLRQSNSTSQAILFNKYNICKLVLIAVLGLSALVNIVECIFLDSRSIQINIYTSILKYFTIILFFVLTCANMIRSVKSSGFLFLFSLTLAICGAPEFRTRLRMKDDIFKVELARNLNHQVVESVSYFVYYPAVLLVLLLNCFADDSGPDNGNNNCESHVKYACPRNKSSALSKALYVWFDPFVLKGYKKSLNRGDLWDLDYKIQTAQIAKRIEKGWFRASNQRKKVRLIYRDSYLRSTKNNSSTSDVSLFRSLYYVFGSNLMFGCSFKLLHSVLNFVGPLILPLIIAFINNKNEYLWHGYFYSVLLLLVGFLQNLLWNRYCDIMVLQGRLIQTALLSLIYKKALQISNGTRKSYTLGEMVNLMAVDAEEFFVSVFYITLLCATPIEICVSLYFLWNKLGLNVLAGLGLWLVLIPVQYIFISGHLKYQAKQMEYKDKRIKLISEILSGIKVLKFNAWESCFEKQVNKIRENEISVSKDKCYLNSFGTVVWTTSPFLVILLTFAAYVLLSGGHLNAEIVFVSLTLFNILRNSMLLVPWSTACLAGVGIAMKRINQFLNAEEVDPDSVSHRNYFEPVIIKNGQFSWDGYNGSPVLRNINLEIKPGALVAVVGVVGCGKSSLLSAILGEMYKQSGFVNTTGTLAYVPQEAWIRNATFKENITLREESGNEFTYDEIIDACALKPDLETLPSGDQTEIGEKGANLSGGQKQRISLARAVHSNADIYLLDDPLSAVDSPVGKHIFEQVIGPNGLLRRKTRIWVTHNISYLSQVNLIVVLKNGLISYLGTFDDLMEKNGDYVHMFDSQPIDKNGEDDNDETMEHVENRKPHSTDNSMLSGKSASTLPSVENPIKVDGQKLIEEEIAGTGNIPWRVFAYYLKAMGPRLIVITIFMNILYQVFFVGSYYWLTLSSSDNFMTNKTKNKSENIDKQYLYFGIYALFGLAQAISIFIHVIVLLLSMLKAAEFIHTRLLSSVFHWPANKFDRTPVGRIISRFGSDIHTLEALLLNSILEATTNMTTVTSTLFVISCTTPLFLFVIPFLGAIYWFVERFYTATSRQLQRMSSVSKAPILSHMAETVAGIQSIRARSLQSRFVKEMQDKIDLNMKSSLTNSVAERWLAIRLQLIGNIIVFFSALFAVLSRDTLSAELVGWSVVFALQITWCLDWSTQKIAEVEMNLVAVERIKEYDDSEREADWKLVPENMPPDWPCNGEIVFDDVVVCYHKASNPVLKGINLRINSGEKIGIVGRTGAGKSSLTLCLFRMIEPTRGRILIDGIDILKIGLHTLRSSLTIIPQDPLLFSGSLRSNLSPIDEHSNDENLWEALDKVNFKNFVSNLENGLQYQVTEGGSNFSVGQRQLLCLARAVLRKTRILILDEATAALDVETDNLIQATIREAFKECTVLTIAHKLNSVLDYDRVMVLEEGSVVEFDSPHTLLELKQSRFRRMAIDAKLI